MFLSKNNYQLSIKASSLIYSIFLRVCARDDVWVCVSFPFLPSAPT